MLQYLLKRLVISACLVYAVATIVFFVLYLVPGDPAEVLLSSGGVAPPAEAVEALREKLGLNQPILQQYGSYLWNLARGDLGKSFADDGPVIESIVQSLPRTLELLVGSTLLSILVGLPLGVLAAIKRGSLIDRAIAVFSGVALSAPVFVIGTLMVLIFAQTLRWVPAGGFVPFTANPWRHLTLLLMPCLAISIGFSAIIMRMTRSTVLDMLEQDYVRTARAKGLAEGVVLVRHVVRNSLGPVTTVVGLQMGAMLGGTVLVEYVFNWPGLSGLLVRAVESRDYPEVQGIVLVISALFILISLLVDLTYAALDPRVKYS
ncbi:ABC transporter permease [Agrobacterium vitis]|uniref:ABC transporter permease n=1 Tax=Agrobacterium vitis TaxID=373 RepID=UPI0012E873E8|nr:ABC transporter permease [Agrobacterium vitis]MUZ65371.1 ABC transporter permease subunit [Agrobacterium vitis]